MNLERIKNGDAPILDIFKKLAPGTNRHCVNVSLLCESVCKEICDTESDSLIIAARLHDIGKCNNPLFFSENQDKTNIHDTLDPYTSYQYITRHVSDSVLKLIQQGFPFDIVRIVSEHHGNTVLRSIFNKIKDDKYLEDDFRYNSSKPTTKESCILMICDVVESATRSMDSVGKLSDISGIIDTLINNLVMDEQLDILTIGQLRVIKTILIKEIESIYHKRVEYDDDEDTI